MKVHPPKNIASTPTVVGVLYCLLLPLGIVQRVLARHTLCRAAHVLRLLCLVCLSLWVFESRAVAEAIPWTELETGLEYAEFDRKDESKSTIVLLRFNPAYFTFQVHSISEQGGAPLTLRQWADKHSLVAAINASMYLTDGRTSTGYMRRHNHVNSKRVVGRFGAFFVAQLYQSLQPAQPVLAAQTAQPSQSAQPNKVVQPANADTISLATQPSQITQSPQTISPSATLLDKDIDPWEEELPKYVSVVQNYRMINAQRRVLWSPGGPLYSISAVGKDGAGNILFIHCREPIEAYVFSTLLLELPIDVRTVMYVEGGAQAGLLVNTSKYARAWAGRSPMDFLITGNINAPLPNVIGVVRGVQPAPADKTTAPIVSPPVSPKPEPPTTPQTSPPPQAQPGNP